jgi:hypothetical protein
VDGARLVKNIGHETRLAGDASYDDSSVLTSFLRRWCQKADDASDDTMLRSYGAVAAEFAHRGLNLRSSCLPNKLLRYTVNRRVVSAMIKRVLGTSAQIDFDTGRLDVAQAFSDLERFWDTESVGSDERLATGRTVFATFNDTAAPVDRDDATAVSNALALPLTLFDARDGMFLYELAYDRTSIADIRFPTVADAGTVYLFRPCDDVPPHSEHPRACFGRTDALEGEHDQPELVHANAPLSVLTKPPRFVGSLDD